MPARDTYHYALRNALESDGWKITDDPLTLKFGETDMYVDLGAEKLMIAEKDDRRSTAFHSSCSTRRRR